MPFNLTLETVFLMSATVAIIAVINLIWLAFMGQKIKNLLGGGEAKDIQGTLVAVHEGLAELKKFRVDLEKYLETVELRLRKSVQSVETVRFNPFKGTGDGGNQSFSTAFIDENGDGVVVSCLYSRERVSVFSKAIKNFNSEFELTEEEQSVVLNSKKKLSSKSK